MNETNTQVSDDSRKMAQGNETMLREINTLHSHAAEISARMGEVSEGIGKINSGAQEVSNLAASAHSTIEKISSIVNEFEV